MAEESVEATQLDFADQLIAELDESEVWPLPREAYARLKASEGRALRKTDRAWLRSAHKWDTDRDYIADSLPKRIAFGWADFLFANDITVTAAGDKTVQKDDAESGEAGNASNTAHDIAQEEIDHTIEVNRMPALLHRMERVAVSEGEVYWKLHTNHAVADVALMSFCSRLSTVPLFYGEQLVAAAFVTERHRTYERFNVSDETEQEIVWRHAEIHTNGRVLNLLYRGTLDLLGRQVALDQITQTAGYKPEWVHGLPMLAGRVVNDLDDDDTFGVSEYECVLDELLALNEALTIAVENARLTGKDRVFANGRFMQADGSFDSSLEVFQVEDDEAVMGEGQSKPPIVAIEKSYDAVPLWLHITNLVKTIVNRVGLVPQWIGENTEGPAMTGVAIRLQFIPTTNAAKGKLREWAHVIPAILDLQLKVAALPVENNGFGRDVAQAEPPAVEFADPIPNDQSRDLLDVSAAVVSEVMSRRTGIQTLHPEWTQDQVDEEIAEINQEKGELPVVGPPIAPAHAPTSAGR